MLAMPLLWFVAATYAGGDLQVSVPTDLAEAASVALPSGVALNDWSRAVAGRDGLFYVLGNSSPGAFGSPPLVSLRVFDGAGDQVNSWVNDNQLDQPAGLFVPPQGSGAFVLGRINAFVPGSGIVNATSVMRIDGDERTWRIQQPATAAPSQSIAGSADGERLFVTSVANGTTALASLNPLDGSQRWGIQLGMGMAAVDLDCDAAGQRVYVLLSASSPVVSDQVIAFDGANGSVVWTSNITPVIGKPGFNRFLARPDGSQLFIGFEGSGFGPRLLALNGLSGAAQWTLPLPHSPSSSANQAVAAMEFDPAGPDIFVVTRQGSSQSPGYMVLHAVRPVGLTKWSSPLPLAFGFFGMPFPDAQIAFDGTRVYASARLAASSPAATGIVALERDSGAVLWNIQGGPTVDNAANGLLATEIAGQPALLGTGTVTAADGTPDIRLSLFQAVDGASIWTESYGVGSSTPRALGLFAPSAANRLFALVDLVEGPQAVFAVERQTLAPLWKRELSANYSLAAAFGSGKRLVGDPAGERVFATRIGSFSTSGVDPRLDALDGTSGDPLWSLTFGLNGLPPASGDVVDLEWAEVEGLGPVLFALHDGFNFIPPSPVVRAIDPTTGTTLWAERYFESSPSEFWRVGTMDVDAELGVVYTLVSRQVPDRFAVVLRNAANGQLLDVHDLLAPIAVALPGIGRPLSEDLVLSPDGQHLYVLAQYLGTLVEPGRLVLARVVSSSGQVDWVRDLVASPFTPNGQAEIQVGLDGGVIAVAAGLRDASQGDRLYTVAVDAQSGALLWSRIEGSEATPQVYVDADLDPSGRALVVTEQSGGAAQTTALDLVRGTVLWQSQAAAAGDSLRAAVVTSDATAVYVAVDTTAPSEAGDAYALRLAPGPLVSGPDEVSLASPETAVFLLQRPLASAGSPYWVLGSATGTTPFPLAPGVDLPLVFDTYFQLTITGANQAPFSGTLGLLDGDGRGRAEIQIPLGVPPSLAGLTLHHAFLEWTAVGPVFASGAAPLLLIP